jgi:hypothetical protein
MNEIIKEISKSGQPTYKYGSKYIYSSYDPFKEAERFLKNQSSLKKIVLTLCGADYINLLLSENESVALVISLEPIAFENLSTDKKLLRVKNAGALENIIFEKKLAVKDITFLIWQPLVESLPDIYLPELQNIKNILTKSAFSNNTEKAFGFLETKNFFLNLNKLKSLSIITVGKNTLNNPALIISSGPSLNTQIDFIKKIENKCTTFSLPSALPILEYNKIYPNFIIAVDPGYPTYYHLAKYRKPAHLLTTLNISPSVLNISNYTVIFFSYGNLFENLFYKNTSVLTSLSEGSVFMNALRILPVFGFKETLLIGQDFGFINSSSHARECFFEKEFLSASGYFKSMEGEISRTLNSYEKTVIKENDREIKTTIPLKLYYEHFIKESFDIKIILPDECFNPLGDRYKKVNADYFLGKYKNKKNINRYINAVILSDFKDRKKEIFIKLKNMLNDKDDRFINEAFIDIKNKKHINKLNKILKAQN